MNILIMLISIYIATTTILLVKALKDIQVLQRLFVAQATALHKRFGITKKETAETLKEYFEKNIDFTN